MKAKAYGAGTVVNALATFKGCAFGISLKTEVKIEVDENIKTSYIHGVDDEKANFVVNKILSSLGLKAVVEVDSEIPKGMGLGGSSAFVNALICAGFKERGEVLNAYRILKTNSRVSLEAGISYTGAFDDASASLLGGINFSDNKKMKLFKIENLEGKAIILIPEWNRKKVELKKSGKELVEKAFLLALDGKYKEAMYLNSLYYCSSFELPLEPILVSKDLDVSAGLSGNGTAYIAFGNDVNELKKIWENFGEVLFVKIVNKPSENVFIPKEIFI